MTDNQKKLSRHEMSMTEGVRAEGDTIRDRTQNSSTDLTVGTPPVCGEPGYHRIYGEDGVDKSAELQGLLWPTLYFQPSVVMPSAFCERWRITWLTTDSERPG